MIFLNLVLLGGLAAVCVPVVLHLLHRNKVLRRPWGAMMFLEELAAERAREIKFQEWLLLLVRAALVATVVLGLGRPMIPISRAGARGLGEHASTVLLFDDTPSLSAGHSRTAWQEARELALRFIDTLRSGDDVTILFASAARSGPLPEPLYDLERVKELLREAVPSAGKARMPEALEAGLRILSRRHNPRRELVVFSDLQAHTWQGADPEAWAQLRTLARKSQPEPHLVFVTVGERAPANLAVLECSPSRAVIDSFGPVGFDFVVANEGPGPAGEVSVTFLVDGAPKATKGLELPAGAREVLRFEHHFTTPGSHHVACRVRGNQDELEVDNILYHSVVVHDTLPVLLVDGDRRMKPFESETDYLRAALAPVDPEDPGWRTVIEPAVVEASEFRFEDLEPYRVVVLANVAALPGRVISALERFVMTGGGLLIALGDRVQIAAYNRDLYRQGAGLLPAPLTRRVDMRPGAPGAERGGAPAPPLAPPLHLANLVASSPALALFRTDRGMLWSKATIRSYLDVDAEGSSEGRQLAVYSDGGRAIVQKRLGEGRVTLFTTAVDNDWSDLPVHPFYVSLMQSLVFDLAATGIPPRNLEVGQPLTCVLREAGGVRPQLLYRADGPPLPLRMQSQGAHTILSYDQPLAPGLYTVGPEGAGPGERIHYAVRGDPGESRMARLGPGERVRLGDELGALFASDWDELAVAVGLEQGGVELAPLLIGLALALCFVEIWITRRWS